MVGNPQILHTYMLRKLVPSMRYNNENPYEWQKTARTRLKELLKMPICNTTDNLIEVEWEKQNDLYKEIRFTFESEKGYRPVVHLLLPRFKTKVPVMICLQGHSTGMHISIGRPKYLGDEESIKGDRDFAIQAVERGFAAFAIEQRGFGECGGNENGPACTGPSFTALLLGRTLLGERVFDIMRLIDVILSEFPEMVDVKHICITGNSGGGTTSLYAAAVDERIYLSAPSCAFSSFYNSIVVTTHCACNYIPGISREFDMGDIAALTAPRALVICAGREDPVFPIQQANEQFEITRNVYRAMNSENKVQLIEGQEGHRYYKTIIWPEICSKVLTD